MKINGARSAENGRLLKFLGIGREKPSIDALRELVFAYVTRIPFENISKLYYLKRYGSRIIPDFARFLDGLERYHFGGTCYTNNYYLHLLLEHLGYDVDLCGADMNNPDVHMVNIVRIENREFLIDAGYAAPFTEPLPRDLEKVYSLELGRDRYLLDPCDERGYSRMTVVHNGSVRHGYIAKPVPRTIDYFHDVIVDSYRASGTFMNALLLTRFFKNRSIRIQNLSVIYSEGSDHRIEEVENRENLPSVIENLFGIPAEISKEALSLIGVLGDVWN